MDHATVLIVDDTPDIIRLINNLLKEEYKVKIATNGNKAIKIAHSETPPDLILLDVLMPEMDGYEVCRQLQADFKTQHIPIIFLTAKTGVADEEKGLDLGAIDYITKPISPPILLRRIKTHLELKFIRDSLREQNEILEEKVAERTLHLEELQRATVAAMGSLAETRDPETGNHILRTQYYVKLLCEKLVDHPRFRHFLTPNTINAMYTSAPLHDIGKVGIPDEILLKEGELTTDEFDKIKMHTVLGRDAIGTVEKTISKENQYLAFGKEIAIAHHEKWDGSGYPNGLTGDEIPISARLMAVADVYDALISRRIYKRAFTHDEAAAIIARGKGTHFDPDMVDAFLEYAHEFYAIAKQYTDDEPELEIDRSSL